MKLEIVTHCWRYPRLLMYQLSSLVVNPTKNVQVTMTVFYSEEDLRTVEVLQEFVKMPKPDTLVIRPWVLPTGRLMRRLIGRNLAALSTESDWIWFTDCDYLFLEGALDALPRAVSRKSGPLLFPGSIMIHATHELGDRAIEAANGNARLVSVDPSEFVVERYNRAIGGVQIARSEVVREKGYLRDSPLHQQTSRRWLRAKEDTDFRKTLGTRGRRIHLPNVFRIRHSKCGRDDKNLSL